MKRRSNLALGALLMAGLGYMVGILTAPKSGKETREDLQRSAHKAKREAEKKLKEVHAELGDLIKQGKSKAKQLSTRAKTELNSAVKTGQVATDKVKNALSAIHEGESDDEDLQSALDEANKAVEHLKKYVSKGKNASKTSKN